MIVCGSALAVGIGEPAPAFSLPNAAGDAVSLSSLRGRVVYVDFWASWCAPCRYSFPWMNEMQQRYGERGLSIVAINVDRRHDDAERFLAVHPARFTVLYDDQGVAPEAYAVKGMPSSYLLDAQGHVVAVDLGFKDDRKSAIEDRIRALLAGQ